ncbi:MAG: hypothetical protein H7246_05685 [Phycisphaerae bacterium]|nr:hypothetical protein [Saprospiraceae bacterium]
MKNSFALLLICLFAGFTGFSQTQKEGRYFGGNLRFGSDKTKYDNGTSSQTNHLNARVDIGKFLHDDFAIGAALQMEREASTKGSKSRYFNPQLLGTARYYAGKEKAKIFLAGQLGLSFSHSSSLALAGTDFEEREGSTQIGGAYGIAAGAAWFLTPSVAVEGMAGWEGHALPKSNSNVSFTGLKIGLTAYLGPSGKKPSPSDTTGKYANYGGKIGVGISIFDGLGVPVRYYLSPKKVLDGGIYFAGIAVTEYEETQLKFGPMLGGGFTFFGDRFEKTSKQKIRAHGLALRLNYLTGDYSTTMLSAGWAMETFKKARSNRSFIFELGLRGQFPNYEIEGEPAKLSPGLYLRCHWNFFLG